MFSPLSCLIIKVGLFESGSKVHILYLVWFFFHYIFLYFSHFLLWTYSFYNKYYIFHLLSPFLTIGTLSLFLPPFVFLFLRNWVTCPIEFSTFWIWAMASLWWCLICFSIPLYKLVISWGLLSIPFSLIVLCFSGYITSGAYNVWLSSLLIILRLISGFGVVHLIHSFDVPHQLSSHC